MEVSTTARIRRELLRATCIRFVRWNLQETSDFACYVFAFLLRLVPKHRYWNKLRLPDAEPGPINGTAIGMLCGLNFRNGQSGYRVHFLPLADRVPSANPNFGGPWVKDDDGGGLSPYHFQSPCNVPDFDYRPYKGRHPIRG